MKLTKDVNIIIHLAAMIGVQKCMTNVRRTLEVNIMGTNNILKAVSVNHSCEQVIFFSTSEIFGDSAINISENGNTLFPQIQSPRWGYSILRM